MTRLRFFGLFAGLAGLLKGQAIVKGQAGRPPYPGATQWRDLKTNQLYQDTGGITRLVPEWYIGNAALNGQCPVCGTIADPYIRTRTAENSCSPPIAGSIRGCWDTPDPSERNVRCKHCNASFWQDGEVRK